ncbi:AAA family ATPase [Truepera radiovictrix]|nr:AAA family ATPase [Truepera radiovictrix]
MNAKGTQDFIVEDLLFVKTQAMIYAPTGHIKTFTSRDVVCHVATGLDFNGKKVKQTNVLYVAAEGADEFEKRLIAWEDYYGISTRDHLEFVDVPLQLHDEGHMRFVRKWLIAHNGGLVVFDTAEKCTIGTDENAPTQVNLRVNAPLERIKQETGATTLLVHHQGTGKYPRPRGCTAWETPNDTLMRVQTTFLDWQTRNTPIESVLQIEKQRGMPPFGLKFKPIRVDVPRYHEDATTLILLPQGMADVKAQSERKQSKRKQMRKIPYLFRLVALLEKRGDLTAKEVADVLHDGKLTTAKPALSKAKGKTIVNVGGKWGVRASDVVPQTAQPETTDAGVRELAGVA